MHRTSGQDWLKIWTICDLAVMAVMAVSRLACLRWEVGHLWRGACSKKNIEKLLRSEKCHEIYWEPFSWARRSNLVTWLWVKTNPRSKCITPPIASLGTAAGPASKVWKVCCWNMLKDENNKHTPLTKLFLAYKHLQATPTQSWCSCGALSISLSIPFFSLSYKYTDIDIKI